MKHITQTGCNNNAIMVKRAPVRTAPWQYRAMGGVEGTLNGAELKKLYSVIRDFSDVLMNLKYLGRFLKTTDYTPNYDLIHDRFMRESCEQDYDEAVACLEMMINKLEYGLRDMQASKVKQEVSLIGDV